MSEFEQTPRNKVKRVANRGAYDNETVYGIIDEARICHIGFAVEGRPFVIPTLHARTGGHLIVHGAKTSRLMKHVQAGHEICVTFTLLDGLVLARSAFHHSMNYRSVVLFGTGQAVEDEAGKIADFETLVERIMPGRWNDARKPNAKELNATTLLRIAIESASAKVRTGPPVDDEEDYALPVWAGELPIRRQFSNPVNDPALREGILLPDYIARSRKCW